MGAKIQDRRNGRQHTASPEFDYHRAEIPRNEADELKVLGANIRRILDRVRRTVSAGTLEMGRELTTVQAKLAKHKNGTFGKWVKQYCGFTDRTARRCIRAFACFGGEYSDTVSEYFDVSAMYLLSSDTCPDEVTEHALELARDGKRITKKLAKKMINEATLDANTAENSDRTYSRDFSERFSAVWPGLLQLEKLYSEHPEVAKAFHLLGPVMKSLQGNSRGKSRNSE